MAMKVKGSSGKEYECNAIVARYDDECSRCHGNVKGEDVWWAKGLRPFHVKCPPVTRPIPGRVSSSKSIPTPAAAPSLPRNKRPGYCDVCGESIPAGAGQLWRCGGGDTGCMEHFDYEEGGWHVSHLPDDKALCDSNLAAAQTARAERQAIDAERRSLEAETVSAIQAGERPEGTHSPEGEVLADTSNIYGGGAWYVVGAEYIWYVRNNGGDGDDWSHNNVRTGGAGAVGWRVAYSSPLAAKVRRLHEMAVS